MKTIDLRTDPRIRKFIRTVAPKYRKLSAFYTVTDSVTPSGTCWDDGFRSSYWHVTKYGGVKSVPAPTAPVQFGGGDPAPFKIPEGDYVVCLGTFRGRTAVAHVYENRQEDQS